MGGGFSRISPKHQQHQVQHPAPEGFDGYTHIEGVPTLGYIQLPDGQRKVVNLATGKTTPWSKFRQQLSSMDNFDDDQWKVYYIMNKQHLVFRNYQKVRYYYAPPCDIGALMR